MATEHHQTNNSFSTQLHNGLFNGAPVNGNIINRLTQMHQQSSESSFTDASESQPMLTGSTNDMTGRQQLAATASRPISTNGSHPPLSSINNEGSNGSFNSCITEWVRLNIGGKYFITTKTTLCKNADSFFYKLCQDDPSMGLTTDKDETGAFLIDRDPKYFAPILNYLRHGKLIVEKNLMEEGVLEEAEFYNIPDLILLLKEKIRERDASTTKPNQNVKRVYRVIQFRENEITQMMSTMSDGWTFVQIVNVGHGYNYTQEDNSEFLLIVSKEYGINESINESETGSDKRKKIVQHA